MSCTVPYTFVGRCFLFAIRVHSVIQRPTTRGQSESADWTYSSASTINIWWVVFCDRQRPYFSRAYVCHLAINGTLIDPNALQEAVVQASSLANSRESQPHRCLCCNRTSMRWQDSRLNSTFRASLKHFVCMHLGQCARTPIARSDWNTRARSRPYLWLANREPHHFKCWRNSNVPMQIVIVIASIWKTFVRSAFQSSRRTSAAMPKFDRDCVNNLGCPLNRQDRPDAMGADEMKAIINVEC